MPEVVEVLLTALYLNDKLKNRDLTNLKILSGRYSRHELQGKNLIDKNKPLTITNVESKGKFMWFELKDKRNKKYYILNRFGLTGEWTNTIDNNSGIEFEIDGTDKIYFSDQRNFGTLAVTNSIQDLNNELDALSPDFLKQSFTNNEFHDRLKKFLYKSGSKIDKTRANKEIIKVLMDQNERTGLGSGLGNYLTVEILYDAKISPHTKVKTIYENKSLSNKLAQSIKYITKKAFLATNIGYFEHLSQSLVDFINDLRKKIFNNKEHDNNYHKDIIINKTDVFAFSVYRQKTDPHGNKVIGDKIIPGRTTYWSPSIQTN